MSEYQYYEFLAIDRPLDRAAQDELRSISTRARITATSFTNHYEWGDFKGDPRAFVEQWFDLHLYLANWGTRQLMMRVPKGFLSLEDIEPFLREIDWVKVRTSGGNLIIDICRNEEEPREDWDDGTGWLATLAPLRADVLSGDLRLFYILWLTAVQEELVSEDDVEPLPGIGPLTGALEGLAEFFQLDPDLVQVAAECGAGEEATSRTELRASLAAIPEHEKTALLLRVVEGDGHVAAELRSRIRKQHQAPAAPRRTVAALRARAQDVAEARERADAERREAERRRQAEEDERARRARLALLRQRGKGVWLEVEQEIERRNASGYDNAAGLLADLQALAAEKGQQVEFARQLASIRLRHNAKRKLLERLVKLG